MLKSDDIKRLVKNAKNWQVEFKFAKGGVLDAFCEAYSAFAKTAVKFWTNAETAVNLAVKQRRKGESAPKIAVNQMFSGF